MYIPVLHRNEIKCVNDIYFVDLLNQTDFINLNYAYEKHVIFVIFPAENGTNLSEML